MVSVAVFVSKVATMSHSSCWIAEPLAGSVVRGWRLVGSCLDIYFAASRLFKFDMSNYEGL